jgi:uncharacterized protein
VFATDHIAAGTRILEYTGDRITPDEADARYPDDPSVPFHTFLFAVDDDTVIDATPWGSLARWVNHSCEPNCETTIENGRVWVETMRDILPGEELSYDYNFVLPERHTPARKRRYPCICGAPGCRGTMLARKR